MHWSIFLIDRASLFTDHKISGRPIRAEYKHFRTNWEHIFDNSPTDSFLLLWSGGHRCREQILCRVVELSCFPTHNIVPHISWHDLPYHKTMKKYENSQSMEAFLFSPRKFAIQRWFCNCPQYLCLFHIVFECTQVFKIKERCWFFHIDFFIEYFPQRNNVLFLSSQIDVLHFHR